MKKFILGILGIISVCCVTACNKVEEVEQPKVTDNQPTAVVEQSEKKQLYQEVSISDFSAIKERPDSAKRYVEENVKKILVLSFGDDIEDIKVTETNVSFDKKENISGEDIVRSEVMAGDAESKEKLFFDVTFDIMLSKIADPTYYIVGGSYNESTRWVTGKKGTGTLVYDGNEVTVEQFDIIS